MHDYEAFFRKHLKNVGKDLYTDDCLRADCPFCKSRQTFLARITDGRWKCEWRRCKAQGYRKDFEERLGVNSPTAQNATPKAEGKAAQNDKAPARSPLEEILGQRIFEPSQPRYESRTSTQGRMEELKPIDSNPSASASSVEIINAVLSKSDEFYASKKSEERESSKTVRKRQPKKWRERYNTILELALKGYSHKRIAQETDYSEARISHITNSEIYRKREDEYWRMNRERLLDEEQVRKEIERHERLTRRASKRMRPREYFQRPPLAGSGEGEKVIRELIRLRKLDVEKANKG